MVTEHVVIKRRYETGPKYTTRKSCVGNMICLLYTTCRLRQSYLFIYTYFNTVNSRFTKFYLKDLALHDEEFGLSITPTYGTRGKLNYVNI